MGLILDRKKAKEVARKLKAQGKKIVFTNGCFDILHRGHIFSLKFAKDHGDVLFVGVNTDDSVRRLKGEGRPIIPLDDRMVVLSSIVYVDYVVPFDEDTPLNLIKEVVPDVLVKGGDYRKDTVVGAEFVEKIGGKVIIAPYLEGFSTTELIERIRRISP